MLRVTGGSKKLRIKLLIKCTLPTNRPCGKRAMAKTCQHSDVGNVCHLIMVSAEEGCQGIDQQEPTSPQCPSTTAKIPWGCLGVSSASSHHLPFLRCKSLDKIPVAWV